MEKIEPLSKRIAGVLSQKTRKSQLEAPDEPKENPVAKALDHLYESLSDDDTTSSMHCVYHLAKLLDVEHEVAFEIPEKKESPDMHHTEEPDDSMMPPLQQ